MLKSRTGGGARKRRGGDRRQIRPEPRGYATLTRELSTLVNEWREELKQRQ